MISPAERFDAFSSNRLNKKDNGVGYQLSSSHVIGPKTHALFVFFHLLNRSVSSAPWIFYLSLLFTSAQIFAQQFEPYNAGIWRDDYPKLKTFFKVCTIIVRYVPANTSDVAEFVVFGFAATLSVLHLLNFIYIIYLLKRQKNALTYIKVFFFYSFLFFPMFQSCFITTSAKHIRAIFEHPAVGTFFLSAGALVVLGMIVFMSIIAAIATGTSPTPNISNPIAIWAPNSADSALFFVMYAFCFSMVEFECNTKGILLKVLLLVRLVLTCTLAIFHIPKIYYISFGYYQYITAAFMSFNLYGILLVILTFHHGIIPYWALFVVWIFLPIIIFSLLKIYTHIRVNKVLIKLNNSQKVEGRKSDEEPLISDIDLGKSESALFAVRTACILGLDCFIDGSLVRYVLTTYDDLAFQMLYMSFLIPDNLNFLKQLIDSYLSRRNPKFLESAILFQLITSIQESSNEMSSEISREISKQTLAGFKIETILSKFWAGCYKGDLSQMSRSTYMLYQNLSELYQGWKELVMRYPYSQPTLKEYVKFLSGVGRQHKLAESILKFHPKLLDAPTNITNLNQDNEINVQILHQSIEEAVDRRPLSSLSTTKLRLTITTILAFLFIIAAIVIAFIFLNISSGMSNYLYNSDISCSLIIHTPNLFEKIKNNETDGRECFFNHSVVLDVSFTSLLQSMPDKILRSQSNMSNLLYNKVREYQNKENTGIVKFLRLYSYYARSLPFVPVTDDLVTLMQNNTFSLGYLVFNASDAELISIQKIISDLNKYIPIFYGVTWGVTILIMAPLVFFALQNVKAELKYIFNLYLTIPRSVITNFMNSDSKIGNQRAGQIVQSGYFNIPTGTLPEEEVTQIVQPNKEFRGVDNLKLLVHDQTATTSVIPKYFQLKVWLILGSITFVLLIAATAEVFLFTNFVNEMILSFRTLQIVARRTIGCSIALQGLLSNFTLFPYDWAVWRLQLSKEFNSKLLLAVEGDVSKDFLTSPDYYELAHNKFCTNESNIDCWPFTHIFDYFMILISKAYNSSITDKEMSDLVSLYNNYLYPRSYELHEAGYEYIEGRFKDEQLILLLIFFIVIIFVALNSFIFLRPIIKQLDETIEAVKLPLKYIPPIKVPDLPRIMQYLQGEADWHQGRSNTENSDSKFGNYLNIIEYPHAIFEKDKSLLFANPSFYNLIGAPREACIGLSIEAIFGRLINFKADPKHPFNYVLEYMSDHDGKEEVCMKITTQFERGTHKSKHVDIHLSKIEAEDDKYVFVLSFDDLTNHYMKEEMARYERQMAENLRHYTFPQPLYNALTIEGGEIKEKTYDRAAQACFSISYATLRGENEGDLADGCSLFMKSAKEVSGVFPNIVKLVHEPPHFIFLSIPDDSEPVDVMAIQMVHFINAVINSFNTSSQKFKISAIMLVGQILLVPLKAKLAVVEAFGHGYKRLIIARNRIKNTGKFYVTKDTAALLTDQNSVALSEDHDYDLVLVTNKHIDE